MAISKDKLKDYFTGESHVSTHDMLSHKVNNKSSTLLRIKNTSPSFILCQRAFNEMQLDKLWQLNAGELACCHTGPETSACIINESITSHRCVRPSGLGLGVEVNESECSGSGPQLQLSFPS